MTRMKERRRGRPKQYDRAAVLDRAVDTFHTKGYAATSLDDLAKAMQMNRPSLYNAFGDKERLYRESLAHFTEHLNAALSELLFDEPDLERALMEFYSGALDAYFAKEPARGCFIFCTAPTEAVSHPGVAADVRAILLHVDRTLERRFLLAKREDKLPETFDCGQAGKLAQAVLHSIALRARAGETRRALSRMTRSAIALMCSAG